MGDILVYRYRPMRAFPTSSTTSVIRGSFVGSDISQGARGGQQPRRRKCRLDVDFRNFVATEVSRAKNCKAALGRPRLARGLIVHPSLFLARRYVTMFAYISRFLCACLQAETVFGQSGVPDFGNMSATSPLNWSLSSVRCCRTSISATQGLGKNNGRADSGAPQEFSCSRS